MAQNNKTYYINSDGSYDSRYPLGNKPSSGLVASYNFNTGDNMQTEKNGFAWDANSSTVATPAGQTESGIPYTFTGIGNNVVTETIFERRFSFGELDKAWAHTRVFIPSNYKHRAILLGDVVGDITSWQVGDSIVANDGSTATLYGIDSQQIKLEFAQNDLYPATWTANITNTTRAQTRANTRAGNVPNNNKLFVFWCDGYSTAGINPSFGFESHSVNGLYSSAYWHFAADHGPADDTHDEFTDFITAGDIGYWMDIAYSVELSSALNISDGKVGMWLKRHGESVYTKKIDATGLPLWKRTGTPDALKAGYVHGAQNSGYYTTTILTDSMFELYSSKPSFLP